jgi:hypothetical protein
MLLFGRQGQWSSFVLGALLCFGVSTSSIAGTVYTWKTDEGTISFTDEQKRIPAKYRLSADTREMGSLDSYPRYTPTGRTNVSQPEQKVSLRGSNESRPADAQRVRESGFDGRAISLGKGRYGGGTRLQLPLDTTADADGGPIVTDTVRVRPENSLATRTITVVKQDGRIIAVTRGQPHQRSWAGTTATGQVEEDVLRDSR